RTRRAGLALARQADPVAGVDPGRDLHREDFLLFHPAGAAAGRAGIGDDLAAPMAVRTGLLHGEDAALHAHLAPAVAGGAGVVPAVLRARALAVAAGREGRELDPLLDPGHGFFQVQLEHVAHVGAAAGPAAGTAAAEDVADDFGEDVAHGDADANL